MATMRTIPETVQMTKLRQSVSVRWTHFWPSKPHGGSGIGGPCGPIQAIGRFSSKYLKIWGQRKKLLHTQKYFLCHRYGGQMQELHSWPRGRGRGEDYVIPVIPSAMLHCTGSSPLVAWRSWIPPMTETDCLLQFSSRATWKAPCNYLPHRRWNRLRPKGKWRGFILLLRSIDPIH